METTEPSCFPHLFRAERKIMSEIRTFHEIAIALNDLGVKLLLDANFAEAAECFREAIKCELVRRETQIPSCSNPSATNLNKRNNLKRKLPSTDSSSPSSTAGGLLGTSSPISVRPTVALVQESSGLPSAVVNLFKRYRPSSLLPPTIPRTPSPPHYYSATAHIIYSEGISMSTFLKSPLDEGSPIPSTTPNKAIMSSLITFNLALAYHLHGVSEMANCASFLRKAKDLYEKSIRLLFSSVDGAGVHHSTRTAITDLLSMALLNNSAQISFEFSAHQDVQYLSACLLRFAAARATYDTEKATTAMSRLRAVFFLNATIDLQCPTVAVAA